MNPAVEVILFDLGGVLVQLGEAGPIDAAWLPENSEFKLADWFSSETAILFEKGLIDAKSFANAFRKELKTDATSEQILSHFTAWPTGLFDGVEQLLTSLKDGYRLAVLSNSNELHWPRITTDFKINEQYFETVFASHHMKMAKPDAAIFETVIKELNVLPEKILFVDDNASNVESAKSLGINAHQVKDFNHVCQTFSRVGVSVPESLLNE